MSRLTELRDKMNSIPEYSVWKGIKKRCYNPNNRQYPDYGGRGILMSDPWKKSFKTFYSDIGPRPSKEYSIDRIDVDGNYCKENCRWVTNLEQQNNKRTSVFLTAFGKTQTIKQWAREYGFNDNFLRHRINKLNMTPEEAITMPKHEMKRKK